MKRLYYKDNEEELFLKDREKAIELLLAVGFNEEVLKKQIEHSERDYGEEFFWTVANNPDDLDEWAKKYDLSNEVNARNFVLYCTDFG